MRRRAKRPPRSSYASLGILGILLAYAGLVYLALDAARDLPGMLFLALLFALLTFALTCLLISQFLLPVKSIQERTKIFHRLLGFFLGEKGPVIFVRDGKSIATHAEKDRKGPGVLLSDHASAAVLRTNTRFTRSVGPGQVVFTTPGERPAEELDLRQQERTALGEPPATGSSAELSAVNSLAVTLDGIPLAAKLSVRFLLQREFPLQPGIIPDPPPYHTQEVAIQKAVFGRVHDGESGIPWSEIPMRLVVEIWRDLVKQKPLEAFISTRRPVGQMLREIEETMFARLTGDPSTHGDQGSPEASLLSERGIHVLGVEISELSLPQDIQSDRLRDWFSNWAGPIQRELSEAEEQERYARKEGEAQASAELAESLTGSLRQELAWEKSLNQKDTLLLLLSDASEIASADSSVRSFESELRLIIADLKTRDANCRPPSMEDPR